MSVKVNNKTAYRAIARFVAMTSTALPSGASVQAHRDRRGRLLLECAWAAPGGADPSSSVRIVILSETLRSYLTATRRQRLGAQARFLLWVTERLEGAAAGPAAPVKEEWIMGPDQLLPQGIGG